jgi:hypothetical protein
LAGANFEETVGILPRYDADDRWVYMLLLDRVDQPQDEAHKSLGTSAGRGRRDNETLRKSITDDSFVDSTTAMASDEEEIERFRSSMFKGRFGTQFHLLDICLGRTKPGKVDQLSRDALTHGDLRKLSTMVKIELLAGMEKCLDGTEDASEKIDPHPFDLFLLKVTMKQVTSQKSKRHVALCVPSRKDLLWYDGYVNISRLHEEDPKWRLASLSGASRILNALSEHSNLKSTAMSREGLVDAVELDDMGEELESFRHLTEKMNYSQRQAVATVISPTFRTGFFAIQGPPGCGSTCSSGVWGMCCLWFNFHTLTVCIFSVFHHRDNYLCWND